MIILIVVDIVDFNKNNPNLYKDLYNIYKMIPIYLMCLILFNKTQKFYIKSAEIERISSTVHMEVKLTVYLRSFYNFNLLLIRYFN